MTGRHLMQLRFDPPALMRFAQGQGLLNHDDSGHGYSVHAWLAAMFGPHAPHPFRLFEPRAELLGYTAADRDALLEHARAFAPPHAWTALAPESLVTKPMPARWRAGQRLQVEVLACPVSRKDGHEKDVFLRALDRLGDAAPPRAEVYVDWFRRQWDGAVCFEQAELAGTSRCRMLRRAHGAHTDGAPRRAQTIERPRALFRAIARVEDGAAFDRLLVRGIGRHRAFGFGMVLLSPAP